MMINPGQPEWRGGGGLRGGPGGAVWRGVLAGQECGGYCPAWHDWGFWSPPPESPGCYQILQVRITVTAS
jgi:hypothetical protein